MDKAARERARELCEKAKDAMQTGNYRVAAELGPRLANCLRPALDALDAADSDNARLRARVSELEAAQGWLPPKTAPRESDAEFIGLFEDGVVCRVKNIAYYKKWPHEEGGPVLEYRFTQVLEDALYPDNDLLGWIPLPAPPVGDR